MKPYYEGWYMKQQQGEDVLAVIPGRAQDSAFIQVVSNRGSRFLPYPLEAFDRTDGSMRIGDSLFTPYGMQLRIDEPDFELVGSVRYDHLLPLRAATRFPAAISGCSASTFDKTPPSCWPSPKYRWVRSASPAVSA